MPKPKDNQGGKLQGPGATRSDSKPPVKVNGGENSRNEFSSGKARKGAQGPPPAESNPKSKPINEKPVSSVVSATK